MLRFIVVTTGTNTDGTTTVTYEGREAKAAHIIHEELERPAKGEKRSVYHDISTDRGLVCGAIWTAYRTARNSVSYSGGNATQIRIDRELTALNAKLSTYNSAVEIYESMYRTCGQDSRDMISTANIALFNAMRNGERIEKCYHAAFLELNAYLSKLRAASQSEVSTEYIRQAGGQLVTVASGIAHIIRKNARYMPTISRSITEHEADEIGTALHNSMSALTQAQARTIELLARGHSIRRIAQMTKRAESTVRGHVASARVAMASHIAENAPFVMQYLDRDNIHGAPMANKRKPPEYYAARRARLAGEPERANKILADAVMKRAAAAYAEHAAIERAERAAAAAQAAAAADIEAYK